MLFTVHSGDLCEKVVAETPMEAAEFALAYCPGELVGKMTAVYPANRPEEMVFISTEKILVRQFEGGK